MLFSTTGLLFSKHVGCKKNAAMNIKKNLLNTGWVIYWYFDKAGF